MERQRLRTATPHHERQPWSRQSIFSLFCHVVLCSKKVSVCRFSEDGYEGTRQHRCDITRSVWPAEVCSQPPRIERIHKDAVFRQVPGCIGRKLIDCALRNGVRNLILQPAYGKYICAENTQGQIVGGLLITFEMSPRLGGMIYWI